MPEGWFSQFFLGRRYSVFLWVLPFLQRFSSASSLCTVSFIDLFFSFSFSYFFFHCSAVSSRFTVTVFLMVLALIGGDAGRSRDRAGERGREGDSDRARGKHTEKCERTAETGGSVNKGISALAAQWKWARISLIGMQIGFLPTVFDGACSEEEVYGGESENVKAP